MAKMATTFEEVKDRLHQAYGAAKAVSAARVSVARLCPARLPRLDRAQLMLTRTVSPLQKHA
jgi:hypothetical protein